jgi:hypothetical protein
MDSQVPTMPSLPITAFSAASAPATSSCALLARLQCFNANLASVQARELHLVGDTVRVNMHDHTHIAQLQPERGKRGHEYNLGVFLKHQHLLVWLKPGKSLDSSVCDWNRWATALRFERMKVGNCP